MRIVAFSALLLMSAPLAAQDASSPAPAPVKEKKICRSVMSTGSILGGKRECHTRSEWVAIDRTNRKSADDMVERTRINAGLPKAQ